MAYISKGGQLILRGGSGRVAIQVLDAEGTPITPTSLSLEVYDLCDQLLYTEEVLPTPAATPRVETSGTGVYYLNWGDPAAAENTPDQTETHLARDVLFVWKVSDDSAPFVNETTEFQQVRIVLPRVAALSDRLRLRLDKALKPYMPSLADPCFVGYTEFMLQDFLLGGLHFVNDYQPYPMWCDVADFPAHHSSLLIDAAVYYGLSTQQIFSIDTDITSYSDQGHTFLIDHAPRIAGAMQPLYASLDKRIPLMKWHYVRTGSVRTEVSPNYRLNAVIQSAPSGGLFRNAIVS